MIEVSGRTYPVEVRYRPRAGADEVDDEEELEDAIVATAEDRWREVTGDVLVFLPGEREIRETAELLRRGMQRRPYAAARGPAAVRAALGARAEPGVQRRRGTADRAGDQRGRDLAHGAGHPLRDRSGTGARQSLLAAQQDHAAADREDLAGQRQPAQGALRPRRRRHLRAALRRGRFRRATALHRSGNAALLAGGRDPAHGRARPRRGRGLSVPRSARRARSATASSRWSSCGAFDRPPPDGARPHPRAAADRPARRPDDSRREGAPLRRRDAGDRAARCRCPTRATDRWRSSRRPPGAPCAFATSVPIFLSLLALWEFFDGKLAEKAHASAAGGGVPRAVRVLAAVARMARRPHPAGRRNGGARAGSGPRRCPREIDNARYASVQPRRCWPACWGTSDCATRTAKAPRRPRYPLPPASRIGAGEEEAQGGARRRRLVETSRLYARCAGASNRIGSRRSRATGDARPLEPHWDNDRARGRLASDTVQLYGLTLVPRRARARSPHRPPVPLAPPGTCARR